MIQAARRGPTSHGFVSQRLRLNYVNWGNELAPKLLLIHGGQDHCRSWDWVAELLCEKWHVIAPDLRGHGDSDHVSDGNYEMLDFVYDLAELIDSLGLAPLTIVGHSLGGNIALRYAGLFPENVRKLVAIEGLGVSPTIQAERTATGMPTRIRKWVGKKRAFAGRKPRCYPSLDAALARMQAENPFLSEEQARHLTLHGARRNEDGSYSWKFDNHLRAFPPVDMAQADIEGLWAAITCPTLLCYGDKSWASNPKQDGRARHFVDARVISFPDAGHWLHHDQFDAFMRELTAFL